MSRTPTLTREAWADAALDALARGGPKAVAVEPIARELGVTKGSFYHHFSGRDELIRAALARWEDRGTAIVRDKVAGRDPAARIEVLFLAAIENAIDPRHGRLLAHLSAHVDDPVVGPVLARITGLRLDYLTESWVAAGHAPGEARRRALFAYTAYLGTIQLAIAAPDRVPTGESLREYVARLVEILVRS